MGDTFPNQVLIPNMETLHSTIWVLRTLWESLQNLQLLSSNSLGALDSGIVEPLMGEVFKDVAIVAAAKVPASFVFGRGLPHVFQNIPSTVSMQRCNI